MNAKRHATQAAETDRSHVPEPESDSVSCRLHGTSPTSPRPDSTKRTGSRAMRKETIPPCAAGKASLYPMNPPPLPNPLFKFRLITLITSDARRPFGSLLKPQAPMPACPTSNTPGARAAEAPEAPSKAVALSALLSIPTYISISTMHVHRCDGPPTNPALYVKALQQHPVSVLWPGIVAWYDRCQHRLFCTVQRHIIGFRSNALPFVTLLLDRPRRRTTRTLVQYAWLNHAIARRRLCSDACAL